MVRLSRTDASGALRDENELDSDSEFEPVPPARSRSARAQLSAEQDGDAQIVNQTVSEATDADENTGTSSPSVAVMTGTHFHSLDEKGRIIVPAKLRPALTGQFWMMLDEHDNIGIYNFQTGLDILEYFESQMADEPDNEDIARAVKRTTEAMDFVTAEGGWRVLVPEYLRFKAKLDKEVVTVGELNRAVLWDRVKWEADQATLKGESPEVRQMQGKMLRAAAAGVGKKKLAAKAPTVHEEQHVAGAAVEPGTVTHGAEAASSGDDRRGSRVFTMSQLGRGR